MINFIESIGAQFSKSDLFILTVGGCILVIAFTGTWLTSRVLTEKGERLDFVSKVLIFMFYYLILSNTAHLIHYVIYY